MAKLCRLINEQNVEGLQIILIDDALSFFLRNYWVGDQYEEILQKLINNCMKSEQRKDFYFMEVDYTLKKYEKRPGEERIESL